MTTIEELKACLEQNKSIDELIVLKYDKESFLADHYLHHLTKSKEVEYLNDLTIFSKKYKNLFGEEQKALRVYRCDNLGYIDEGNILKEANLIIVCNKFANKKIETFFQPYTIYLPKLEAWQIKDYVYSIAQGTNEKGLDRLLDLCKNDLYRLQQELDKISIFNEKERKFIFEDFINDKVFNDLSTYNIFNFTNAISKKDLNTIANVYKEKDKCDITEMNLLVILCQSFRNTILVQLNSNPNEQNTGLSSKQIWAIKNNNCGFYSKTQLLKIYEFLTHIDAKIKLGEMPMDILIDYLMIHILSI